MRTEIEQLFHTLTDLSPDARAQYLAEHEIDGETRREAEALLAFDSGASAFLAREVSIAAGRALPQLDGKGLRCGPYRLLDTVGRGGMGTVYLAERVDGEVTQRAAVKLLAPGAGEIQRERFLQERQILASLSHPNIARLLDAGHLESGQPFLAMEYVDGEPIDVFAAGMSVRDRIALFLKVCAAVAYLHRNQVVHRDLKPSNILVTGAASGQPGEPKLLDFGIAKLLDIATDSTLTGLRMLTPDYASPEQMAGGQLSAATDTYSLGAVLYKLLTGKPAHEFDDRSAEGIARTVITREVTRPSKWAPELKGDLESILLKALRKDPRERYANVNEFAEDLKAYLASRAVRARSGTAWYRARKFLRRNRTAVLTAGLAVAASAAGVMGILIVARTARAPSELALLKKPPTSDAEAYRLYLRGRYFSDRRTSEDLVKALEYFKEAIHRDSKFALAYAAASECYPMMVSAGFRKLDEVTLDEMRDYVSSALRLEPNLEEAIVAEAVLRMYERDWPSAEQSYRRAIQLNPNDTQAHLWYGLLLDAMGRERENLAERKRAWELEPLNWIASAALGGALGRAGRHDEAIKQLQSAVELNPSFYYTRQNLGLEFLAKGMLVQAIREFQAAPDLPSLGFAYALSGKKQEALGVLERMRANPLSTSFDFAIVNVGLGRTSEALDLLEQAYRERAMHLMFLRVDERLASLRGSPRFEALAARMKIPAPEREH
jgi:tetratricopeptide (TPR) repeat protein